LLNTDTVHFSIDTSLVPPPDEPVKVMTAEELQDYKERNWVNEESGEYYICGKMGREEEEELLLSIVAEYVARDVVAPVEVASVVMATVDPNLSVQPLVEAREIVPSLTTDALPAEYIDPKAVSAAFGGGALAPPLIFALSPSCSLENEAFQREAFVNQLRFHGFAFVSLSQADQDKVCALRRDLEAFFGLPDQTAFPGLANQAKLDCHHPILKYLGYVDNRRSWRKELLQVRRSNTRMLEGFWDSSQELKEAKSSADAAYGLLYRVSTVLSRAVLTHAGCSDAYISTLFEPHVDDDRFGSQLSTSNLSLFHYLGRDVSTLETPEHNGPAAATTATATAAESVSVSVSVTCPYHSDMSLLTTIPLCYGSGTKPAFQALHFWDYATGKWLDVETNAPPGTCVVFAGEIMAFLTSQQMQPGLHEVSSAGCEVSARASRVSTPFQLLAARDSVLDPAQATAWLSSSHPAAAVVAGDFIERLSRSRVSSNFVRNSLSSSSSTNA